MVRVINLFKVLASVDDHLLNVPSQVFHRAGVIPAHSRFKLCQQVKNLLVVRFTPSASILVILLKLTAQLVQLLFLRALQFLLEVEHQFKYTLVV